MPLGLRIEAIELTFTIAPFPCFSMIGSTCLAVRKKLFTLTSNTRCHSSSLSSTGPPWEPMPTLLSRMSMRPHFSMQASTIAFTLVLWDALASKATATSLPTSFSIRPTVSSAAARFRSTQNTFAPSRAKVIAVHLPLPQPGPLDPAPTTIATLSFSLPDMPLRSRAISFSSSANDGSGPAQCNGAVLWPERAPRGRSGWPAPRRR